MPRMASSKDFLDYVLEQLSSLPDITYRAMMGEYILYYRGKVAGGIYDNRLLVKPTASALKILPNAPEEIPYEGAKPMLLIQDVDDRETLERLFDAIYPDLPEKKKERKRC